LSWLKKSRSTISLLCIRAAQRSSGSIFSGPAGPKLPLLPQFAPSARRWLAIVTTSSSSADHPACQSAVGAQ
jgi:hypothetical protein